MVIILDASTSVTERNFQKMLQFCKDFLRNADIDSGSVRVGVLIYSTEVNILSCQLLLCTFLIFERCPFVSKAVRKISYQNV